MATPLTLKVFRGEELLRSEQFNRDIIKIGRLASAHLVLDDDRVSRIHSVIEVGADGAVSIIDMGSAEGTFVNGKKVSRGALRAGDQITLGGVRIVEPAQGKGSAKGAHVTHDRGKKLPLFQGQGHRPAVLSHQPAQGQPDSHAAMLHWLFRQSRFLSGKPSIRHPRL